jgi:tetratricopeptide (TPR) repeat protein
MGGVERRLAQARELQAAGEYDQAIVALNEILAERADHAEANFLLGGALLQTGRPRLAIAPLEKATRSELYAVPARLMLASILLRTESYDESIRTADAVLEREPDNPTALFTRGQAYIAAAKPDRALADAERVLELRPDANNARMLKGRALIGLGRRDEAEQIWIDLRETTAASGDSDQAARACAQLALFYRTQQELEAADRTYVECLAAYPRHADLQRWASEFYLRQNRPERAIEIHRDAVAADPLDIPARGRLANLLFTYGAPGDARTTLEETVERFDTPEAWRLLADFHRKTGDATAARKALEEAMQRTPEPREAFLFSLADLLVEEGDLERAREIGSRLTEPSYRHLLDGAISLKAGDPKQALVHLDLGLPLWPGNPRAHYLAGQAALEIQDRKRAVLEFREALRLGESATDAAQRLAEIDFSAGRYASAARFAQRQIARRPFVGDPTAYQIAIRSALELDQPQRARQLVEALRRAAPDRAWADAEQARIEERTGGKGQG